MNLLRSLLASLALCGCSLGSFAAPEPQDTIVTADHFESRSTDSEMTMTVWGNVVVTGTDIRITCDRMVIIVVPKGERGQVVAKQNEFRSLLATGRVKIVQGEREATCGRAEVLPGEDRITLTENPMVVDKGAQVTWIGENLRLLRGESQVFGDNVKMIFSGEFRSHGFDPKKALNLPAPTPPASTAVPPANATNAPASTPAPKK